MFRSDINLKSIIFVLAGLSTTSAFFGQAVQAQDQDAQIAEARRRVVAAPRHTRLASSTVIVPLVGTKTLPLVEARLNGKGPYRLLVDTGADVTLLQMRVADELKLPVLRPGTTSKLLALERLTIGGATFVDLVVGAKSWNENIDGVIGFNLFAELLLTFDYPRQRLALRKGVLPPANQKDILAYGLDNRHPTLEIILGNERLTFLIDTGASQAIVVPNAIASKLRFRDGLAAGPVLTTLDTKSPSRIGRLSGSIRLGIHEISEPTVHVLEEDEALLGSALFKDFILTFDQKNRTVRIGV